MRAEPELGAFSVLEGLGGFRAWGMHTVEGCRDVSLFVPIANFKTRNLIFSKSSSPEPHS